MATQSFSSEVNQMGESIPFFDILSGENAFYNSPDYVESTQRDFASNASLPVSYTWNTEHKIIRIAKQILSIIIFPIGIYKLIHSLVGKFVLVPASLESLNYENQLRLKINLIDEIDEWKYKRITVKVNGYKIDAIIVGKASTLSNRRWVLASNGNGELYENNFFTREGREVYYFKQILKSINSNAIVFNYPGVGASSGLPSRKAMTKAYRAMLTFLEDKDNGIGAKEIIGYGHSIGGGVQGDALREHELKEDIGYVFVKSRTFSNLAIEASFKTNCSLVGFLIKILGWNINPAESSKRLQVPEFILQTISHDRSNFFPEELTESSQIIDDGMILAEASLAKNLLDDDQCPRENKIFLGLKETHNIGLLEPTWLARKIESYLPNFEDKHEVKVIGL